MAVDCAGPFRADEPGKLPRDGPATVAGIELPAGHRIADGRLWITDEPVPFARLLWADLAEQFETTGLWPVVVEGSLDRLEQPVTPPAARDAETILRDLWDAFIELMEEDAAPFVAPFGEEFPGRTPTQRDCRYNAIDHIRNGPLSDSSVVKDDLILVPVQRPADVPAAIGWNETTDFEYAEDISVVLRSWEDSLGAYLTLLRPNGMEIAIERPPQDDDGQWLWAAEQLAFNLDVAIQYDSLADFVALSVKFEDGAAFWWD